jgi:hypothetical protein
MTSLEAWHEFLDQPKLAKRVTNWTKMRLVFPALMEMYEEQYPYARKPRVIVMDCLRDTFRSGMSYREWAKVARSRLRLEIGPDKDELRTRGIKISRPEIGCPELRI